MSESDFSEFRVPVSNEEDIEFIGKNLVPLPEPLKMNMGRFEPKTCHFIEQKLIRLL